MTSTIPSIRRAARGFGRVGPALALLLFWKGVAPALSLNPDTGVVPNVFSPNGDGKNDAVCFVFDNPRLIELRGRVWDAHGSDVADLRPATTACAPTVTETTDLMWDGRDRAGRTVPAGPYVYRIEGDGAVFSGVVVVVK